MLNFAIKISQIIRKDEKLFYDVKITYHGKSVVVRALYDSGNGLDEPISGKMVHIAKYEVLKPLLEGDDNKYSLDD